MLIVADENMPYVREWFAPFGEVRTLPGRALDAESLRGAEALLVRSVTRVDERLLQQGRLRFVGSATSGIEHIDTDYLNVQGIAYANAPGCNATAVVEYVLSCLCALDGVLEKLLAGGTVGIIGFGHVGARLARRLEALDIRCVGYDPLLAAHSGLPLRGLDSVLDADVVCCHVPLTAGGEYPTYHLLDTRRLRQLRTGTVLINASRGAVVDNSALLDLMHERDDLRVILDVWESEPKIDLSLLEAMTLATPHIAGYSWDGKVAGTQAVLEAFCRFFRLPLPTQAIAASRPVVNLTAHATPAALLGSAIQSVYDVRRDDCDMRAALMPCEKNQIAGAFDRLRKNYPQRREIAECVIGNWAEFSIGDQSLLRRLGFSPAY